MRRLILCLALAFWASAAPAALVIDDFSLAQSPLVSGPGNGSPVSSEVGHSLSILGAYRRIEVLKTAGPTTPAEAASADVTVGVFHFAITALSSGAAVLRWDGLHSNLGLGGLDLASSGSHFAVQLLSTSGTGSASIEVIDMNGAVSVFTALLSSLNPPPPQTYNIAFSSFAGIADFSNVGAIQVTFTGGLSLDALAHEHSPTRSGAFVADADQGAFVVSMDRLSITTIPSAGTAALVAITLLLMGLPLRRG